MSDPTLAYQAVEVSDDGPQAGPKSDAWGGVLRGIFLAVSWTWCIGMYLPVLLIRDFGYGAWIAFAVPNIIGAALVGRWLNRRARAEGFIARHAVATRWFSLVTIAFQGYFLGWQVLALPGAYRQFQAQWPWQLLLVAFLLLVWGGRRRPWVVLGSAVVVLGISAVCGYAVMGSQGLPGRWNWTNPFDLLQSVFGQNVLGALRAVTTETSRIFNQMLTSFFVPSTSTFPVGGPEGRWDLAALVPVCVLGFLTCPILDSTFQATARDAGARQRKTAFFVLFPVVFGMLIWLTAGYENTVGGQRESIMFRDEGAPKLVAIHWAVQAMMTVLFHLMTLGRARDGLLALFGGLLLGYLSWAVPVNAPVASPGFQWAELGYRAFLGFYGLVFPAYILLRAVPARPASMAVMWGTIILASPFFACGFFTPHIVWAVPGVAIVVVVFLVHRLRARSLR